MTEQIYESWVEEENRKMLEEENRKFMRNMFELKEQSCLNKLNSGMNCQKHCTAYGTTECMHPERVFPKVRL